MRYLPQTKNSRQSMMDTVGAKHIDDLFVDVPAQAMIDGRLRQPKSRRP